MFKPTNSMQVIKGIDDWLDEAEELADGVLRGLAVEALEFVLKETPQWTGNLAASWTLTVGAPAGPSETVFKSIEPPLKDTWPWDSERAKGMARGSQAINYALAQARGDGSFHLIRLGVPVFISTSVPYAQAVETDTHETKKIQFLRPENAPGEMVFRAKAMIENKGEITLPAARRLASRWA